MFFRLFRHFLSVVKKLVVLVTQKTLPARQRIPSPKTFPCTITRALIQKLGHHSPL